jgi:hypothetical protein
MFFFLLFQLLASSSSQPPGISCRFLYSKRIVQEIYSFTASRFVNERQDHRGPCVLLYYHMF